MLKDKTAFTIAAKELVGLSQEVLEKGGIVRIQVSGNCMSPFVRDRDFVHIKPIPLSEVKIGDMVVYRIGDEGMHLYLVYRKPAQDDTRVFLGKVIAIERDGCLRNLEGRFSQARKTLWFLLNIPKVLMRKLKTMA